MKFLTLTDGQKMLATSVGVTLILMGIAAVFGYGEVSRQIDQDLTQNAVVTWYWSTQAHQALMEARRREKDFQIRRDEKYIGGVREAVKQFNSAVEGYQKVTLAPELRKQVDGLPVLISAYGDAFDKFSASQVELGLDEKSGLQGHLRKAVRDVESILKEWQVPTLQVSMLMMRRREKDFILRGDEKYIKLLGEESRTFSDRLDESDRIPSDVKEQIRAALATYVNSFNAYSTIHLTVVQDGKVVSQAAHAIEPVLADVEKQAVTTYQATNARRAEHSVMLRWVMGVVLFAGSLIVIGLILWLNRSIKKSIAGVVVSLMDASAALSGAAGQVSSSSQALAEGASEQAASLEETSSTLEEMSGMTRQNSDNAKQADLLAKEARTSSGKGSEAMSRMVSAIEAIKGSSDETAKIIKTIDEIAFQTNLLALNAAVEAARAGDVGKGFAVVAEEVRNLAQRSAEAAKNTSDLIESSQEKSAAGVGVAAEVEKLLVEVNGSVEKVSDILNEVAAASDEQARGVDQVNSAVTQMDEVTQQNAANAEETASASQELSSQALSLEALVQRLAGLSGAVNGSHVGKAKAAKNGKQSHDPQEGSHDYGHAYGSAARNSLPHHQPIQGRPEPQPRPDSLKGKIVAELKGANGIHPETYGDLNDSDFRDIRA